MQKTIQSDQESKIPSFLLDFLAGGISVSISKSIVAPIERVKLILQTQYANTHLLKGNGEYKGIIDTFIRISKEEGALAFWRGNLANVMRYFPNQALNLAIKDLYRTWFLRDINPHETFKYTIGNFLNGAAAGATTLIASYPLDYARTILATDLGSSTTRQYKGILHCMKSCIETDGYLGLYKGFMPAFFGITLFRSIYFGGYDTLSTLFLSSDHSRRNVANSPLLHRFILAQSVTVFAGTMVYPLDTIRRRLMLQTNNSANNIRYNGSYDCFVKIVKYEGAVGLYKGLYANILRSIGGALVLVLYDDFRKLLRF